MSHSSTNTYTAESIRLNAVLEQMCTEYSIDYRTAYGFYFQLQQAGQVPLIDWSKIK